jgi:hypothetical protein
MALHTAPAYALPIDLPRGHPALTIQARLKPKIRLTRLAQVVVQGIRAVASVALI